MDRGVDKQPAVSMNEFVGKQVRFHVAQSEQITSMHFKMEKVDAAGHVMPEPPAIQGCAREPKRLQGAACYPEVK